MAFPTPHASTTPRTIPGDPSGLGQPTAPRPAGIQTSGRHQGRTNGGFEAEGDHRLEKLEFALAVALTRGDHARTTLLRQQIAALGGNLEEPGT